MGKELIDLVTLGTVYYEDGARATAADIWARASQRSDQQHREMMDRLGDGGSALVGPTLWAIIADMMAYEAEKFDAEPLRYYVTVSAPGKASETMGPYDDKAVAEAMVASYTGAETTAQLEPEFGELNVSGADLVDAFSEWRGQLKTALERIGRR